MKQKILFVEDQEDLGNVVRQYLEIVDFNVEWCTDGSRALQAFESNPKEYDILVIDIQLPGLSGFDLAENVVRISNTIPFLFLTARNEKKDRIYGLKMGADDYICKPFDIDELVLRVRNIIRRNHSPSQPGEHLIASGDIRLNKDLLKLSISGKSQVSLTVREAELLEYLCLHANHVLKREDILVQLWGENDYFLGRSLDVFISRLRKILSPSKSITIDNVYGVGFIFNVRYPEMK